MVMKGNMLLQRYLYQSFNEEIVEYFYCITPT